MFKNPFTPILRYFRLKKLQRMRRRQQEEREEQKRQFMKKNNNKITTLMKMSDKIVPSPHDAPKVTL